MELNFCVLDSFILKKMFTTNCDNKNQIKIDTDRKRFLQKK